MKPKFSDRCFLFVNVVLVICSTVKICLLNPFWGATNFVGWFGFMTILISLIYHAAFGDDDSEPFSEN